MMTMIDNAVGRALNALNEINLAEDTVILFTNDHGEGMGDHSIMLKGRLQYRGLIR